MTRFASISAAYLVRIGNDKKTYQYSNHAKYIHSQPLQGHLLQHRFNEHREN